ncbi:MAG: hypothetical protein NVSMB62_29770 [Acidobacteriaceae bacterium]
MAAPKETESPPPGYDPLAPRTGPKRRSASDSTQVALSKVLRLGGNIISRWEAGRNGQAAAMDILLRLIRDVPGSLHYLREHAA